MSAIIPDPLRIALKAYGIEPEGLQDPSTSLIIGRFMLFSTLATGSAASQTADVVEELDPRMGAFSGQSYLLGLTVDHYAAIEPTSETAFAQIMREAASFAIRWTPVNGAPRWHPIMASMHAGPLVANQVTQGTAADGTFPTLRSDGVRPGRLVPGWLIDLELDTLNLSYGGGTDAPGTSTVGWSFVHVVTGALISKGAMPSTPVLPGTCNPKDIEKALGTPITTALLR